VTAGSGVKGTGALTAVDGGLLLFLS